MASPLPTPQPIDGITSPPAPAIPPPVPVAAPQKPVQPPAAFTGPLLALLSVAVLYTLIGLGLIGLFPSSDGSLQTLRSLSTGIYLFGAVVWAGFGVVGLMRIAAVKGHPRLKVTGLLRLSAVMVPMLLLSAAVLLMVNRSPSYLLDVLSPTSAGEMVAPVAVTFGMESALTVLGPSNDSVLKVSWDFNGDGRPDQETFEPKATYLFDKAGIFASRAAVTMSSGQVYSVTRTIRIPRASFSVEPSSPVVEEPVVFSLQYLVAKGDTAAKLVKAKWDFDGDGVTDLESDKLTVSYIYHKLGAVSVSAALTFSNQTQLSYQRTVTVVKPPEQPFGVTLETEPTTLLGPPPFGVLFVLKTTEPIASASWDFGNGKSGDGLRVAQVFNAVGTYTVSAVARSQSGATAHLSKIVRVTSPLEIRDLTFQGTPEVRGFAIEGQAPLTVDITPVTSQPLISFTWDAPDATEVLATEKSFHATYFDQGKFVVDLIGTDPDQNVFRKRITVTVLPAASAIAFSMDPPTPTAPATVTFDASDTFVPRGEEITGFEWDFGDASLGGGTKFSGSRVTHLFEQPGSYVVTLNVRTTSGKSLKGSQTLLVKAPILDACLLPSRRSGAAPLGVRFDSSCSTGQFDSWLWDFGDHSQSDQQNPTHVFVTPGEYTVTLTARTKAGQSSTKTAVISVSK